MTRTSERRPVLLVIGDEPRMAAVVDQFATGQGFDVIWRAGGQVTLTGLSKLTVDAAIIDLHMPEVSGLTVLRAIRDSNPNCQVIFLTEHASLDSAIEAVKLGALDYLQTPLDFERLGQLLTAVRRGLERRQLLMAVEGEMASRFQFHGMIGRSPVMQELFDAIRRLAPHTRTALVTGEPGTGKELVARALHELGGRGTRPFAVCNCTAIVEASLASELCGHTRGTFTGASEARPGAFELADGGTLFVDEIGELPLTMQTRLLRVIEHGDTQPVGAHEPKKVDVRVIAATNRALDAEVAAGRFRRDLLNRLNVVEIKLPPLRDHSEDIAYLSAAFVSDCAARFTKPITGISPGAERLLRDAPWPGNVRELRNTLERACLLSDGPTLNERDVLKASGAAGTRPMPLANQPRPRTLDRATVEQVLQRHGGNRSAAARGLGLSRRAFYRRLDTFGLR